MAITDSAGTVHIVRLDKTINLHKGVLVLGSMLLGFATFFTHYFVTLADVSIHWNIARVSRGRIPILALSYPHRFPWVNRECALSIL